jgi:hypothetical protein
MLCPHFGRRPALFLFSDAFSFSLLPCSLFLLSSHVLSPYYFSLWPLGNSLFAIYLLSNFKSCPGIRGTACVTPHTWTTATNGRAAGSSPTCRTWSSLVTPCSSASKGRASRHREKVSNQAAQYSRRAASQPGRYRGRTAASRAGRYRRRASSQTGRFKRRASLLPFQWRTPLERWSRTVQNDRIFSLPPSAKRLTRSVE